MFDQCIHSLISLRLESFVIQTVLRAGYALSSVEGRVAMEFFELSEASQAKKYEIVFLVPGIRCYSQASPYIFMFFPVCVFHTAKFLSIILLLIDGFSIVQICIQVSSKIRGRKRHCVSSKCNCIPPHVSIYLFIFLLLEEL